MDESRKKTAVIHRRILINVMIFNNLRKKIPHFVCSLQQEPEAYATGHVQMPDVVSARCNKNLKRMPQAMSRCQMSWVPTATKTGTSEHKAFLYILLTFNILSHFAGSKFVDESRKKTATIHSYILTNTLIFNNLHEKISHFVCPLLEKTGNAGHRICPDARCRVCPLLRKT